MGNIEINAYAKINLTLDILGKRSDGYHEVKMIMQTIFLHDVVSLVKAKTQSTLSCNHPAVPLDNSNLALKAVHLLEDYLGRELPVDINIQKHIPVAAGLAGGSTNGAAVLNGLNKLYDLKLSLVQLLELAAQLGSDVPFCVLGGTALAYGRGELVRQLTPLPQVWMVVAKPPLAVSTAAVYQAFSMERVSQRPDTESVLAAIAAQDVAVINNSLCNVLESVTLELYPEVRQLKQHLLELGCRQVLMSGSGPTVFGIVKDREEGERIAVALKGYDEVFVTCTFIPGKDDSVGEKTNYC